jgi:hypothetical protein
MPAASRLLLLFFLTLPAALVADTITLGGAITQGTEDGTGPAINNVGLNDIADGDAYILTLNFSGSISGPGNYNLTGFNLSFNDPTASAVETDFNSVNWTVTSNAGLYRISMLACLTTGTQGCAGGNQLTLNFGIPLSGLNQQNVTAQSLPLLMPLDLLEDDGVTDIHGSVNTYSYANASEVPEPGSLALLGSGLVAILAKRKKLL